MAHVGSRNAKSQFQRGCSYKQVGERKTNALCSVLPVDLGGTQSDRNRYSVHRNCNDHFIQELAAIGCPLRCVGAGHAVRKLDQGNDGNGNVLAGCASCNFGQRLPGILALSF
jgi:hypothetical protein